jgi:hypothetical protein
LFYLYHQKDSGLQDLFGRLHSRPSLDEFDQHQKRNEIVGARIVFG